MNKSNKEGQPITPRSGVHLDRLVSWRDKNGTRIKPGDNVLVENDNRNISETGTVTHDGKILFTKLATLNETFMSKRLDDKMVKKQWTTQY